MYSRYRNQKARHWYELETKSIMTNVIKQDQFIEERKRLRSPRINGANNKRIDGDSVNIEKTLNKY